MSSAALLKIRWADLMPMPMPGMSSGAYVGAGAVVLVLLGLLGLVWLGAGRSRRRAGEVAPTDDRSV